MRGSNQAANVNLNHGQINPGLNTGFDTFVVADQPPVAHEPAERPLDNPNRKVIKHDLG